MVPAARWGLLGARQQRWRTGATTCRGEVGRRKAEADDCGDAARTRGRTQERESEKRDERESRPASQMEHEDGSDPRARQKLQRRCEVKDATRWMYALRGGPTVLPPAGIRTMAQGSGGGPSGGAELDKTWCARVSRPVRTTQRHPFPGAQQVGPPARSVGPSSWPTVRNRQRKLSFALLLAHSPQPSHKPDAAVIAIHTTAVRRLSRAPIGHGPAAGRVRRGLGRSMSMDQCGVAKVSSWSNPTPRQRWTQLRRDATGTRRATERPYREHRENADSSGFRS